MIEKIVKNTTVSDIEYPQVGVTVPASGQYTINASEYQQWSERLTGSTFETKILSGDLVVNDGTVDLTAVEGIHLLEHSHRLSVEKDDSSVEHYIEKLNFEGDVSAIDDGAGKVTVTIGQEGTATGKMFDFLFVASGNVANKWLGIGNGSTSSDSLPLIIPYTADLKALTFSNQDDNVDINILVYVNGALAYTWLVRNKRTAWLTDILMTAVNQGDRISIFLQKYTGGTGDSTAQDPIVEILFSATNDNLGEGGTQYGV